MTMGQDRRDKNEPTLSNLKTKAESWQGGKMWARGLFGMNVGIIGVYAVSVLTARIIGYGSQSYEVILFLMGAVFVLELLLYGVARYSVRSLFVDHMLVIMKIGTATSTLMCMLALIGYGFAFMVFPSPAMVGFYIISGYIILFMLWLLIPGMVYAIKICLAKRRKAKARKD